MLIQIDPHSRIPIYLQIYEGIISAIAHGELKDGSVLPSARRLAKDLEINYHTANKAYNLLELEGFVTSNGRKTMVVTSVTKEHRDEFAERWNTVMAEMIREAIAKGFSRAELELMFGNLLETILALGENNKSDKK